VPVASVRATTRKSSSGAGVQGAASVCSKDRRVTDQLVGQVAATLGKLWSSSGFRNTPSRMPDREYHVQRCAVTGVGVGDQRDIAEGGDHHAGKFGHLRWGDQTDVGQYGSRSGDDGAREVPRPTDPCAGQIARSSIEDAGRDDQFTFGQQVVKAWPCG